MASKLSTLISALTGKTTPVDADKIPVLDSENSFNHNWLSFSSLKTYLSGLYAPIADVEIGAALTDTDTIPVYDTSITTQKKSLVSRLWTYVEAKLTLNPLILGGVTIDSNQIISGARGTLVNLQSDSYGLLLVDAGKTVLMDKSTAQTLTIPANSSIAFPVGTLINIVQTGDGQVSVAITTDTLNSSGAKVKLTGRYSAATLIKTTSTSWVLIGDLSA
jgi:hypothetical protein